MPAFASLLEERRTLTLLTNWLVAHTFRQLAYQWRDMADQLDKLEHSPVYRIGIGRTSKASASYGASNAVAVTANAPKR